MKGKPLRVGPRWFECLLYVVYGFRVLGPASHASAETPPGRFLIETAQVTAAMREGRLPVDGVRVQLAAPVTASVSAARIYIKSASPVSAHQIRLTLVCSDPAQCLPFLATATYPDGVDVGTLQIERNTKAWARRQPGLQSPVVAHAARSVKSIAPKDSDVLRAGSKAWLEFEADRVHIRIEVVSLQSGKVGSSIEVSSIDHKQIYMAEVITPTLLKGELTK